MPGANTTPSFSGNNSPSNFNGDYQSLFMSLVGDKPANSETLKSIEPELAKYGITLRPNHAGINGKVQLPDGRIIDVGKSFSSANPGDMKWQWLEPNGASGAGPNFGNGLLSPGLSGYYDFAQTGGFSDQDKANYRARAIAPIRATYELGMDQLERAKNLSGGYMPNAGAARSQMARHMSQAIGDQAVNAEASLAEQIRAGRMSGLSGFSNLGLGINSQGLQAQNLGLGLIDSQIKKSQVPSNFDVGLGRVAGIGGMVAPFLNPIGSMFTPKQPTLPGLQTNPYY